jgi:hypothetical protein
MMNWVWLNIPAATAIFAATTGIPLWLVIKHPDTGPGVGAPNQLAPVCGAAAYATAGSATSQLETVRRQFPSPRPTAQGAGVSA